MNKIDSLLFIAITLVLFSVQYVHAQTPTVNTYVPAIGASLTSTITSLQITFSVNMARGSGNITIINFSDNLTEVSLQVSNAAAVLISNNVVTLVARICSMGKSYRVLIPNGALTSTTAVAFPGISGSTWNFHTGAAGASAVIADGPRAFWRFTNPVTDGSGNNIATFTTNTGSLQQSGPTASTSSVRFTGSTYMQMTSSSNTLNGGPAMTIEAWVYPQFTDTARYEIAVRAPWHFNIQSNKICFYVHGLTTVYYCSTASIASNTWTHLTAVADGTNMHLYINGVRDSSRAQEGPTFQVFSGAVLDIGVCSGCGWTSYWNGYIAELAFYDKVLSEEQIMKHALAPGAALSLLITSGLVMRFESTVGLTSLANGTITAWNDQSSNVNHVAAGAKSPFTLTQRTPAGRSAVVFDGSGALLRKTSGVTGLPAGNTDRSMFAIVRYINQSAGGGVAYGTTTCSQAFGLGTDASSNLAVNRYCSSFSSATNGASLGWLSHAAILSSSQLTLYETTQAINVFSSVTFTTTATNIIFGSDMDQVAALNMELAAVLLYNRALSDTERFQVESYLRSQYFGDVNAPFMALFVPEHLSTTVSPTATTLTIVFSESVQAGVGNIVVTRTNDNNIQNINVASTTINGNQVTIPVAALGTGKSYSVSIAAGVFKNMVQTNSAVLSSGRWTFTTINDATPPTISNCPTGVIYTDASNTVTWNTSASDANGVTSTVTTTSPVANLVSGSLFPVGVSNVTIRYGDALNNYAYCSFNVDSRNCTSSVFTPYLIGNESTIVNGATLRLRFVSSTAYLSTSYIFNGATNNLCHSSTSNYWNVNWQACNQISEANIPLNFALANCSFKIDESSTSQTQYSTVVVMRTVQTTTPIRGLVFNRTMDTSVTVAIVFATVINATSANLNVFGSGILYARVISQTFSALTSTATLDILTSIQSPYQLTASQLASVTGFTTTINPINPEGAVPATAQCVSGITSPCNQMWRITIARTTSNCAGGAQTLTNAGWQPSWTIGCHSSFTGACTTPAPNSASALFDTSTDDYCPRLISTLSATATVSAFADNTYVTAIDRYVFGARTYFRAIVNAAINIQAVRIERVSIVSGAASGVNVLYQNTFTNASHYFGASNPAGTYQNQPVVGGAFTATPSLMLISENLAGANAQQRMVTFSWIWSTYTSAASGDSPTATTVQVDLRVRYSNQSTVAVHHNHVQRLSVRMSNHHSSISLLADSSTASSASTTVGVLAVGDNNQNNNPINTQDGSGSSSSSLLSSNLVMGLVAMSVGVAVVVAIVAAIVVRHRRVANEQVLKNQESIQLPNLTSSSSTTYLNNQILQVANEDQEGETQ